MLTSARNMIRVVFDTVVFVRTLINPHNFAGKLIFSYPDRYQLVLSQAIVVEILEVLQRPELVRKFRSLQRMNLAEIVVLLEQAELVEASEIRAVSRDPKDDKFLAAAKAGEASYLVSADKDLLDLGVYEGITIVDIARFLNVLEEQS